MAEVFRSTNIEDPGSFSKNEFIHKIKPLNDIARASIPLDEKGHLQGQMFVIHKDIAGKVPARDHLLASGVAVEKVDQVFDQHGNWMYRGDPEFNPFDPNLTVEKVDEKLREIVAVFYDFNDPSMKDVLPSGLNKHSLEHGDRVTATALGLVRMAREFDTSITDTDEKLAVIISRLHDPTNWLHRHAHAVSSIWMASELVPSLKQSGHWTEIARSLGYHDTSLLQPFLDAHQNASTKQHAKAIRRSMGFAGLANHLADKVDLGVWRVSEKATTPDLVNGDTHKWLNLLLRTSYIGLSKTGKSVIWRLQFSPFIPPEEAERMPELIDTSVAPNEEGELKLVDRLIPRDTYGIETLRKVFGIFEDTYTDRLDSFSKLALELFTGISGVSIVLDGYPSRTRGRRKHSIEYRQERNGNSKLHFHGKE